MSGLLRAASFCVRRCAPI